MIRTCTQGHWNAGTTITSGDGIPTTTEVNCFVPRTVNGRTKYQFGDLNGIKVKDSDQARAMLLERGYLKRFVGRNAIEFKQSRAARRRGWACDDLFYRMKAKRYGNA